MQTTYIHILKKYDQCIRTMQRSLTQNMIWSNKDNLTINTSKIQSVIFTETQEWKQYQINDFRTSDYY